VSPLEGCFVEDGENWFTFDYTPIEYNGSKKAEVNIVSEGGNFDFYLHGKFPTRKSIT